jgi:hypothetical protein
MQGSWYRSVARGRLPIPVTVRRSRLPLTASPRRPVREGGEPAAGAFGFLTRGVMRVSPAGEAANALARGENCYALLPRAPAPFIVPPRGVGAPRRR